MLHDMDRATVLRHIRHVQGLSQRQLGQRAGLSKSTIARIETDDTPVDAFFAAVRAAEFDLIPIPQCPEPPAELLRHLRNTPIDERVEIGLRARGADDLVTRLDAIPRYAQLALVGEVAGLAWSLPTRGP